MNIFPLIKNDSINLTLTDIPYGEVNRKSNGLRNLNKEDADIITFNLRTFINELVRITSGSIYVFCGTEQVSLIRKLMVKANLSTRLCIWEKTNPSPMNGQYIWLSSIECCVFGKKSKATFNEHCKSSVWRFSNGRSKVHKTEKSLDLFKYIIKTSSNENDLVFDPCIGSGTTAIAAKELNRNFIGIEKKKEYYEVALNRLDQIKKGLDDKEQSSLP